MRHTYIEDVVVHSTCWKVHIGHMCEVLTRFAEVHLTINLAKSEFDRAEVTFLGHRLVMDK